MLEQAEGLELGGPSPSTDAISVCQSGLGGFQEDLWGSRQRTCCSSDPDVQQCAKTSKPTYIAFINSGTFSVYSSCWKFACEEFVRFEQARNGVD